jgi:hypothetical protein
LDQADAPVRLSYELKAPAPRAANRRTAARQRAAIGHAIGAFQELLDHLDPDQLERLAIQIREGLGEVDVAASRASFVRELAGGRDYSTDERVSLHLQTLLRTFRRRDELLRDALTAPQVAKLLHTSRQTPHDRVATGHLLAARDRGMLRFPSWQFDPDSPDGVVAELPQVIRALDLSPLAKINWFARPNPYLDGRCPIDALKQGDVAHVRDAAYLSSPK